MLSGCAAIREPEVDIDFLFDGPERAARTLVLAHGAGAPMDHRSMTYFAEALAGRGLRVARFEFPYMAMRRETGRKRPPDRLPVLLETWTGVIEQLSARSRLVIGGKSMGGRIASLVADGARDLGIDGLVCLGYPFHPPGRPEKTRTAHLAGLGTPTLIVQGERDALGSKSEVAGYRLSEAIEVHWLDDGDHGFKPRKASGRTEDENWREAVDRIAGFVEGL